MDETTKNILSVNSVSSVETSNGKHYDERKKKTRDMTKSRINSSKKKKITYDTHDRILWQNFIKIAKDAGFKCGFCQKFKSYLGVEEEEIIFFHKEKGLILHAESFKGKYVNNARVHGEVRFNGENLKENQRKALNGCSYVKNKNCTIYFNVDVRNGFRFHLDSISEAFKFSKSWSKVHLLCFLNYMEIKDKKCSYEKISKQKIEACTREVRKIIFG